MACAFGRVQSFLHTPLGIRMGAEYRERLRDGRTVYVNGERVTDVAAYPPFQRTVDTIAVLHDLQHDPAHQSLLTYAGLGSPR